MSRKGNRGRHKAGPVQPAPALARAKPVMMIEVGVAGIQGTQVYPVNVARELYEELGLALASIDGPDEGAQGAESEDDGTAQQSQSHQQDDQDGQTPDDGEAVADADAPPAA